jgi:dihydrofolate reductase
MRKLIASFFMSLDGVVEAPQEWHFPYMDERMMGTVGESMTAADAILLGRATFEEWAAYWPNEQGAMADYMNGTPKFVASNSLDSVGWENSTLIRGDVAETVAELKQGAGKDISVTGSGTLVRSLLGANLVDELRLMIHPIVVGRGKHLFEDGEEPRELELVSTERFETGVLNLTYAARRNGAGR